MDNMYCYGGEDTLPECRFDGRGTHDCEQTEAAGVQCKANPPPTTPVPPPTTPRPKVGLHETHGESLSVRIAGGRVEQEGRVEVDIKGLGWRPVCGDGWGAREAVVVCRELGFGY